MDTIFSLFEASTFYLIVPNRNASLKQFFSFSAPGASNMENIYMFSLLEAPGAEKLKNCFN